jgi:mxaL protein
MMWLRLLNRLRLHGRLAALALAAAVVALAFVAPRVQLNRPRVEHVVVLDITQSMNVPDEQVDGRSATRLQWAQHALQQAINGLPCGSRLGWAVFTEYRAYLLFTPLEVCAHRSELRRSLQGISSRMAWSGNSEVAKGLHSGITIVKALPRPASLVFISDGHEAPPLDPRQRPPFDDKPGEIKGLIVGVGALQPSPIPKSDPAGRALGFWGADQVQQLDNSGQGRAGSVSGEAMSREGAVNSAVNSAVNTSSTPNAPTAAAAAWLGATPGSEHLSSLREAYLRLLAKENSFAFHRLIQPDGLLQAMREPALARPVLTMVDTRPALAALALLLLMASLLPVAPHHLERDM